MVLYPVRQIRFLKVRILDSLGLGLTFKRKVTLPRTGFVQLSKKTTSRISLVMLLVNIGVFILFAGVYILRLPLWDYFGSFQLSVPLGLIFLIMFSFSGGLLKAPRFYLYGLLVLIAFMGFEYLFIKGVVAHHGIPWAGFFSGGVIFLSGCINLYIFLRRYQIE